ncbi:BON domain-containing protein [Comamonadaceae bacterium G21597-S1]|nr:BON domain-containing protein [Comamonadaceae bacterium G21597-S1]
MLTSYKRTTMTAIACAALLALAACDNGAPEQTAGQKVDAAINTMEQKADAVGAEVKQGVETAKEGAQSAIDNASDTARDAAITTQINADLARDPELSALKIDVDTTDGKVVLKGSAPSDAARERAAAKALAVAGVTAVDNQLRVGS